MTTKRRAVVIGGSMSGLLAAIMLRRHGWHVDVFERVEKELAGRGAGIIAQAELIAHMKALGLETRDLGVDPSCSQYTTWKVRALPLGEWPLSATPHLLRGRT